MLRRILIISGRDLRAQVNINLILQALAENLLFQLFAALAEFERNVISERTKAGLAAAVARGRKGGAPKKINDGNRSQAIAILSDPNVSIDQACQTLGVTRGTLYNHFPDGKRTRSRK